jgi:hypothetical protein
MKIIKKLPLFEYSWPLEASDVGIGPTFTTDSQCSGEVDRWNTETAMTNQTLFHLSKEVF